MDSSWCKISFNRRRLQSHEMIASTLSLLLSRSKPYRAIESKLQRLKTLDRCITSSPTTETLIFSESTKLSRLTTRRIECACRTFSTRSNQSHQGILRVSQDSELKRPKKPWAASQTCLSNLVDRRQTQPRSAEVEVLESCKSYLISAQTHLTLNSLIYQCLTSAKTNILNQSKTNKLCW
jgi:hypothetical protein